MQAPQKTTERRKGEQQYFANVFFLQCTTFSRKAAHCKPYVHNQEYYLDTRKYWLYNSEHRL